MKDRNIDPPIRLPYFDWDKAKHFYYVAKLGSVSEASRFLNLSQPSLSKKITILEYHLRCKLFVRTAKGLDLTRKGRELFAIIEKTFISLKGFSYGAAVAASEGKKQIISISSTHPVAAYVIAKPLLLFQQHNPHIILEVTTNDQLIDLTINDVDIAIRPYDAHARGVYQEPLFKLEKKLFASGEYLKKYGEPSSPEDLINHHIISHSHPEKYPYSNLNWILKVGMTAGEERRPIFMTNSLENAVLAAKQGIGILGGYPEMEIIGNSQLKMILPSLKGPIEEGYVICPTYLEKDKDITLLKTYLIKYS